MSVAKERSRLTLHVLNTALAAAPLTHVSTTTVEARLREMERAGAGPGTVNELRSILHTVFSRGRKAHLWTGANPVEAVETRRVPRRAYDTLRAEEVPLVLSHVAHDWRGFMAAAIYTGMRKGELCGLRKADVDLASGVIVVARSYDRDTTKGRPRRCHPNRPALVPYLEEGLRSPGELVFPWADGRMRFARD